MNELKPIEEGCLAISHNCVMFANNGKVVTVGKFIGVTEEWEGDNHWETNRMFIDTIGESANCLDESKLLRIDDPDLKKEKEEELIYIENDNGR